MDFFSLGTNDLVQYLLAADRDDSSASYYLPLHPAFLALVQNVVLATSAAGRPLSICGEVAGDALFTELLVGLGLRDFSLAPRSLLDVKRVVRSIRTSEAKQLAGRALRLGHGACCLFPGAGPVGSRNPQVHGQLSAPGPHRTDLAPRRLA